MFRYGMIQTINKPTRATRQTANTIHHIIINSIIHTGFKSEIIKPDISNQFPIFFCYINILLKNKMLRRNLYINADSPVSK